MHGRNLPETVHHRNYERRGGGAEVVHIAEVDARYGEIAAVARGGDGNDRDARVAASPHETIGRRWEIPQKPGALAVAGVPASAAAVTPAVRMLERNELEESVGEEDSSEDDDELSVRHRLGKTDDMELDIAETLAYPKHWNNAD